MTKVPPSRLRGGREGGGVPAVFPRAPQDSTNFAQTTFRRSDFSRLRRRLDVRFPERARTLWRSDIPNATLSVSAYATARVSDIRREPIAFRYPTTRVFLRNSIFFRRRTFRDSDINQNRRTVRRFLDQLLVVPGCPRSVRLRFREKPILSLLRILPMGAATAEGGRQKNEEGEVERLGSLRGPEDPILRKSDFSRFRKC